jgi:hypothetical protein
LLVFQRIGVALPKLCRKSFKVASFSHKGIEIVGLADEKEPDMRLRAKATDASVPVEIKIAESWRLEELEAALMSQLCGKYLRAREGRHGILLLVHQTARPQGWVKPEGAVLGFDDVVKHLRAMAVAISGSAPNAPQPEIAVLDVFSFSEKKATTSAPQTPPRRRSRIAR